MRPITKNIISIDLHCYNHYAMDYGRQIAEIVDAAHKHEVVEINAMGEPFDLREIEWKGTKLLDILKLICEENNWPLEKFSFVCNNILQPDDTWPNLTKMIFAEPFRYGININNETNKNIQKHFGIFINNSSWPRLWLSSFLYCDHGPKTLQTFVRDLRNPSHAANLDTDCLFFKFSEAGLIDHLNLDKTFTFLSKIPLTLDNTATNSTQDQHFNTEFKKNSILSPMSSDILLAYDKIFCDVVCETMFSGQVFSIDEKIARCLITRTPFIVFGPEKQLSYLRRLGFKTFSDYWDESYDHCSDAMRCVEISKVLDGLSKKNITEIRQIYLDMKGILDHNRSLYLELCSKENLDDYLNSTKF